MKTELLLEELKSGELAEVGWVEGDGEWVARMAELGLRPGQQLRILQSGSPCVVSLGGSRLSLRTGKAGRIYVRRMAALGEDFDPMK